MKTVAVMVLVVLVVIATGRVLNKIFNDKVDSLFEDWRM